jgi:hypothetical protein
LPVIAICHVTMCIRNSFWKYNTKNRTDYQNKSKQIRKIFYCYFLIFLLVSVPFCKAIINYFISFLKLNNKKFFLLIFVFWYHVIMERSRSSLSFCSRSLLFFEMHWSLSSDKGLRQISFSVRTRDSATKVKPAANSFFLTSTFAFSNVNPWRYCPCQTYWHLKTSSAQYHRLWNTQLLN